MCEFTKIFLVGFLCIFIVSFVFAQDKKKGPIIECPAGTEFHAHTIAPPKASNLRISNQQSQIEVDYIGFSKESKAAFQYAVDIWQSMLKSDIKIRIQATWESLGSGVLGAAGPSLVFRNFRNAPEKNTWYPIALAEKLAGKELNDSTEYDIVASFNSDFDNWYLGTDGKGDNKYDLVSVVLHEIGHGLGFFSADSYEEGVGRWDLSGTNMPMIFTRYIENSEGLNILNVANDTEDLGDYLSSNDLYIGSDLTEKVNGTPAKIYSPTLYSDGSSISHWDESTFNSTDNALMTPQIAPGEVLHHPGSLTLKLFADMGWFSTIVEHEERLVADSNEPIKIKFNIRSDIEYSKDDLSLKYYYSRNNTLNASLVEIHDGSFEATIQPDVTQSTLFYFFDGLVDEYGRELRFPSGVSTYRIALRDIQFRSAPYALEDGGSFDVSTDDFTSLSSSNAYKLWERGVPFGKFDNRSSDAWVTRLDKPIGRPLDNSQNSLITPVFDLSDADMDYIIKFDLMSESSGLDFLSIHYSLDTGKTWQRLGGARDGLGIHWYTRSDYGHFFQGETRDESGDYVERSVSYPLYQLAGNACMFAFIHETLSAGDVRDYDVDGFLIDNFEIEKNAPRARFYSSDTVIYPGNSAKFFYTSSSSGTDSYLWDFGDGNTSEEQNPAHIYNTPGTYTVTLKINSQHGEDIMVKENYLTVLRKLDVPFSLADGGDFESNQYLFYAQNIAGTGFELGKSPVLGKSGAASGEYTWVTGLNDDEYLNDSEAQLLTPAYNFSVIGNYEFRFKSNFKFEDNWDGFIVEYTTDAGKTWKKLNDKKADGWYNQISDEQSVFGRKVPIFSGSTGGEFQQFYTDVSSLGGNSVVIFRFRFLTDAAVVDVGMALDDIEVSGPEYGPVVLDFSVKNNVGCEGQEVTFYNESTGSITEMQWDFGINADPRTATGPGPHSVFYEESGISTVVLAVKDIDNSEFKEEKKDLITTAPLHTPTIFFNNEEQTFESSTGDAYQWLINDEAIEGANEQTFSPDLIGDYSVMVTIDGCTQVSRVEPYILSVLSEFRSLYLYPNPVSDFIKIATTSFENSVVSVTISDLGGRCIMENKLKTSSQKLAIDVKQLNPGIYILNIFDGNSLFTGKLVKE